jgi:Holliday junction resolvase RusA-like endonuclease
MVDDLANLSWQEKRELRFKKWLSPPGIQFPDSKSEKHYKARVTRIIKAITLEEPDRVPVVLPIGFIFGQNANKTYQEMAYNYDELGRAWKKLVGILNRTLITALRWLLRVKLMNYLTTE